MIIRPRAAAATAGVNNITQIGTFTSAPYRCRLDATSSAQSIVTAGAGTGKLGL